MDHATSFRVCNVAGQGIGATATDLAMPSLQNALQAPLSKGARIAMAAMDHEMREERGAGSRTPAIQVSEVRSWPRRALSYGQWRHRGQGALWTARMVGEGRSQSESGHTWRFRNSARRDWILGRGAHSDLAPVSMPVRRAQRAGLRRDLVSMLGPARSLLVADRMLRSAELGGACRDPCGGCATSGESAQPTC